jgi:hypothetical protein
MAGAGIAGVVTVYALGDMMIYNRRKRAEFFAEQRALHESKLHDAREAVRGQRATEEQLQLLAQEREAERAAEEKKQQKGSWARSKEWLFSGLKTEDDAGSAQVAKVESVPGEIMKAVGEKKAQVVAEEKRREQQGGMLDRLGTVEAEKPKSTGWTSFMSRQ